MDAVRGLPLPRVVGPTTIRCSTHLQGWDVNYSDRMRERYQLTGKGMYVDLSPHGGFWSRGWKGCPDCERDVHERAELYYFVDGERSGWRCHR